MIALLMPSPQQQANLSTHHVETGWSTSNLNAMRATCIGCHTWFEAWCVENTWDTVRRAQQTAMQPFGEFACGSHSPQINGAA